MLSFAAFFSAVILVIKDCDQRIYIFNIIQLVSNSTMHNSLLNLRHSKLLVEIFCMLMTAVYE